MNLNPLIKNTFASPDRSRVNNIDMSYIDQKPNDQPQSSVNRFSFSAIKPKKNTINMRTKLETVPQRGLSCNTTNKAKASDLIGNTLNNSVSRPCKEVSIQKIDISQFSSQLEYVPKIKSTSLGVGHINGAKMQK